MPARPGTFCMQHGVTHTHGHHERERRREYDQRKGTRQERGYGARWQKARAGFLAKHPLCAHHEKRGQVVPADTVDHALPHRGDMAIFWESDLWQPLCSGKGGCHEAKTLRENGLAPCGHEATITSARHGVVCVMCGRVTGEAVA